MIWSPLACLVAITHAIETWVKYEALGTVSRCLRGASGNIFLGGFCMLAVIL